VVSLGKKLSAFVGKLKSKRGVDDDFCQRSYFGLSNVHHRKPLPSLSQAFVENPLKTFCQLARG
jgi:hypothetical protein